MELDTIVNNRRSVRKFKDQKVEVSILTEALECARMAPSAVNYQPWEFYICQSQGAKKVVLESYPRAWFEQAPVYIVACGNKEQAWKRTLDEKSHLDIDIAIAVEHLVLKLTDLGLGTCWVCNFDPQVIKAGFRLPEHIEPIVLLPIGYPADSDTEVKKQPRKSLDEIIHLI